MRKSYGGEGVAALECINPRKPTWRIRWAKQSEQDGMASWMEHDFGHKPTAGEVRAIVTEWYNEQVKQRITSGFTWQGITVWLSQENQLNFLAAANSGAVPITLKLGEDDNGSPMYYVFAQTEDLRDFTAAWQSHIRQCLEEGWQAKDGVDWTQYE